MSVFKIYCIVFIAGIFSFSASAQSSSKIPKQFCISQKEYQLYNLINTYRAQINLGAIPLSKSLCFVAKTHAADLAAYYPFGDHCNMHSWSDKGSWKAFCFPADQNKRNDVKDKAKELTDYPGKAWELTYWENFEADLNTVLDFWNSIPYTAAMIANTDQWKAKSWTSMGVGIQDGYVLVWLGTKADVEATVVVCETGEEIMNKSIPNELKVPVSSAIESSKQYYIIIGSFKRKDDAQSAIDNYHQMGYPNACIVDAEGRIRVAIDKYASKNKADSGLKNYREKFQGAWVLSK
jgi:hypothetical protein